MRAADAMKQWPRSEVLELWVAFRKKEVQSPSAGVGNSHASGVPFEQRDAEFVFERPHSATQYRLGNAERFCGASEAQMLCDGKRLRNEDVRGAKVVAVRL